MHRIGLAPGVFDLKSTAQLGFLRNARARCEVLLAGVVSNELLGVIRAQQSARPFNERLEIARSLRDVDAALPLTTLNSVDLWRAIRFDVLLLDAGEVLLDSTEEMWRDLRAVGADVVNLTPACLPPIAHNAREPSNGALDPSGEAVRAKYPHIRAAEGWWP